MDPREFYQTHLMANYRTWIADHSNEVKASNAVSAANNIAEYLFHYVRETQPELLHGAKTPRDYRARIASDVCSDFQIVWDLADGHKHVQLRKPDRNLTVSERALRWKDDQTMTWGEATFTYAESANLLMVELASGELRVLRVTVKRVIDMWDRLIREAGR